MHAAPLSLLLVHLLLTAATPPPPNKNLTIGYLTAVKGELRDRQGLIASGAIQMAVDEVNSNPSLLPNVNLVLQWNDTRGDTVVSTKVITDMLCEGVYAIFGPEGSCYVEAIVAQSRNIPMISYKCSDFRASAVPTFARTEPPDTQVTKSVLALLKYYDWKKFCIVWEDEWGSVAESLKDEAHKSNMTVTGCEQVLSSNKCCRDKLPCCTGSFWYNLITDTRNLTRIYVFLGQAKTLVDMMQTMQALQLFENGEYIVIYADLLTYSPREAYKYIWRYESVSKTTLNCQEGDFLQRARSLLVVVPSPPTKSYESFSEKVRDYNFKPPFNFPTPPFFVKEHEWSKFITVTAANLYDSVLLYARALDKLLKEEPFLNDTIIESIASNGTRIIETIIKNRTYESITGATIKLDANGDSEGNFSVVAVKKLASVVAVAGITGATMKLDANGDSEGNFSVVAVKKLASVVAVAGITGATIKLDTNGDSEGNFSVVAVKKLASVVAVAGITGATIKLDANGDSEGNFSVVAVKKLASVVAVAGITGATIKLDANGDSEGNFSVVAVKKLASVVAVAGITGATIKLDANGDSEGNFSVVAVKKLASVVAVAGITGATIKLDANGDSEGNFSVVAVKKLASVVAVAGITGATIKLDANGDSEGNFSVVAVKKLASVVAVAGITGATIKLDANGDSEGNFSVVAVKKLASVVPVAGITGATIKLDANGDSEGNFSVVAVKKLASVVAVAGITGATIKLDTNGDSEGNFSVVAVKKLASVVAVAGITGATIKLDANGDSEGNFSVVAVKKHDFSVQFGEHNFTCDYYMVPVGQFQQGDHLPEYKLNSPGLQPEWAGGRKPDDEPSCGFNNELCAKDDSQQGSMIVAGLLGLLLFCSSVLTLSIYRKWKVEQEIEGLLWKVDLADLLSYYGNNIVSSPSKTSLMSATSLESRCGGQVFAATGQYRGVVVRIKELKFSKKKDVTRDTMKEMRRLREIRHDNVNSFIGASVEPMRILIITDYCAKGSLYDIVENEDIKLDKMFIASLVNDLIKGMLYLHMSATMCHGNLKSSNCVVTSRWVLQVTDFGLHELRQCAENDSIGEHQYYRNMLWKAPEILRDSHHTPVEGTFKGDVYAFAIILHEIIGRRGPFGACGLDEPSEIIKKVKEVPGPGDAPFRPNLELLRDCEAGQDYVLSVIQDCWAEQPDARPDFRTVRARLKNMREGKQKNIMDQMMDMMEKYANNLEDLVNQRTLEVYEEKRKTEDLLHRMLPAPVAARLTRGFGVEPESFDLVTIYFSDIVGFTQMSAESTPFQVVNFLNDLYTLFDRIIKGYDVYKVETIGDAYMVVSGLPLRNGDSHVGEIASMSLDLLDAVKNYRIAHRPNDTLQLRIGMHTGPVVAGVVGLTMPRYCLFGDTVNTASRMESNGLPLKIHISPQCRQALLKVGGYTIEERGLIHMKGKGDVLTYWLMGTSDDAIKRREVDLDELPPLFCRPRRSPKLMGDNGRRHSSVPRGNSVDRGVPDSFPGPIRRLIRESRSLDPFPDKRLEKLSSAKRSYHSLQEKNLHTLSDGPNGERVMGNGALVCDPLLDAKRWHSLEDMPLENINSKKIITRSSIRSWLFGLFNNSGYRNSDLSLRKNNCNYTDLQAEKESIV